MHARHRRPDKFLSDPGSVVRKLSRRSLAIISGFLTAIIISGVVAFISLNAIRDFVDGSRWVSHTQSVLVNLEELLSLIKDADSNQRGYLISGEERYLDLYRKSVALIPDRLDQIKRLTTDSPRQQKVIESLASYIDERLALQQNVIQSRQSGIDQAEMLQQFTQGQSIQDRMNAQVADFRAEEYALLAQRSAKFEEASVLTKEVIICANLAALTVLAIVGWMLFSEVRRRTRAEQAMKHYVDEVEDLYNNAPCGYYSIDKDGVLVKVNDTWLNWMGYRREEVLCKTRLSDFMTPKSALRFSETFPHFKEIGVLQDVEYEYVSKNGQIIPLSISATAIRDSAGNYLMSRSLAFDMRERKQAEAKFKAILESAPDAMIIVDRSATIQLVNAQAEMLFGYAREELYQHSVEMLMPERYRNRHFEHSMNYFVESKSRPMGRGAELFGLRKDGTEFPVEISLSPFETANGILVSASIRDISERKRAEQTLHQSNAFLSSLIENIPNMIFVKDAESLRFVRFNKAGEELLGYSRDELIGKNDYDFFPEEEANFFTAKDRVVLENKCLVDIPEEEIHTKQHGVRILHTMKIPVADEAGTPRYLLGISEDITASKEAEREIRRLNEDLISHTAQLEVTNRELESFSYSVSHDLRAPLRAIDGFAKMLQEDYASTLDEKGARWLTVIRSNSGRMGQLIDDLLAFSRLGRKPIDVSRFDMNDLVREAIDELDADIAPHRGEIHVAPLGSAVGDRALIKQVWLNLIGNALKYSGTRPQPVIEIFVDQKQNERIYGIKDNGVGFDMQYHGKLFGVFERLHTADEFAGTGVGLAIVQRIVVRHGGRIWAEGEVNKGATFYFTLRTGVDNAED